MISERRSGWYRRALALFWNRREHRIRAFWRVLGAVVVVLVIISLFNSVVVQSLDLPVAVTNLIANGVSTLVALGVLVGWARYVDKRSLRAYGFQFDESWWRLLALGVVVGLLGWGGALATDLAAGWATVSALFSPGTGDLSFPVSITVFAMGWVFVAIWEEVVFRGIVMRNAIEGLNVDAISFRLALAGGWVVSAVVFGVLHLEQATSLLALGFWILAGLVLGLAYLLTDQLAYPIGLHFAFDFSVNNVFGLANVREVSSQVPTIIRPTFTGPDLFIGVAGVVNTAWLLIIGLLTVLVLGWQYDSLEPRIQPYAPDEL